MFSRIHNVLKQPVARGVDIDAPSTTRLRRKILDENVFLRRIYSEWYENISRQLPVSVSGRILEVGAGAGFFADSVCDVITSERFWVPEISLVVDARYLPLRAGTLRAVVMTNVLHHIPDTKLFFREAARCVRPGGVIVMVEPWVTWWSTLIYRHLHHEPFDTAAESWTFPATGPLSGANGALPWIIFQRDRRIFEQALPEWRVASIELVMPFRYLLSGGMTYRNFVPAWSFVFWSAVERLLVRFQSQLAMFAVIVLRRADVCGEGG